MFDIFPAVLMLMPLLNLPESVTDAVLCVSCARLSPALDVELVRYLSPARTCELLLFGVLSTSV